MVDEEGEAGSLLATAELTDLDGPTPMAELCRRLLGVSPRWASLSTEARVVGSQVLLRRGLPHARARWLIGHEIAEWHLARLNYRGEDIERVCDRIGAALAVQRPAFRAAIRSIGRHAVHELARRFATTQSLALLRVGEVTGRPVALLRWPEPIYRGDPFEWPRTSALRRALDEGRAAVHPVAICDEPNRVGLMARR